MKELRETSIDRIQGETSCSVFTSELKFINQIKKWAQKYPNKVSIIAENDDGSILAHVPNEWFNFVGPKKQYNLSQEQREARAARMRAVAEAKKNIQGIK